MTVYSEENTKGVAEKLFDKISMGVNHQFNQSPQQKPGIKTVLYQQKHCRLELKETEKKGGVGQNEKKDYQDFWDPTGWDNRVTYAQTSDILQGKGSLTAKVIKRWQEFHSHHWPRRQGWF